MQAHLFVTGAAFFLRLRFLVWCSVFFLFLFFACVFLLFPVNGSWYQVEHCFLNGLYFWRRAGPPHPWGVTSTIFIRPFQQLYDIGNPIQFLLKAAPGLPHHHFWEQHSVLQISFGLLGARLCADCSDTCSETLVCKQINAHSAAVKGGPVLLHSK